jgi:hypothetical protein
MERSRSSRTSRAPRSLPRAERNCQPGRRANCSRQGSGLSIRAAERLLASCGSPASKRSWVRTSLLLWIVGAAPAGRALRHSSERPGRADRTHAPAHEQAHGSALPMVLGGAHSPRRSGSPRSSRFRLRVERVVPTAFPEPGAGSPVGPAARTRRRKGAARSPVRESSSV